MKKAALALIGLIGAGGVFYLSRTNYPPGNAQVQGALGGRRLAQNATVCVTPINNLSEQKSDLDGITDEMVGQLNKVGYRARLVSGQGRNDHPQALANCDATVYGEVANLKGKDRGEAEVDFRLLIAGDQTPYFSSTAKGKGANLPSTADVVLAATPGKKPAVARDYSGAHRAAVVAAFADAARQIETQRPARSTRPADAE